MRTCIAKDKRLKFKILVYICSVCMAAVLCGCSKNAKTDDKTDTLSDTEISDTEPEEYEEDYVEEYKNRSTFEICGYEISFDVPDRFYSYGINDYDDLVFENFYSDDTMQMYTATINSLIIYDAPEDFGRQIYSEVKESIADSGEISLPCSETVDGNTVTYITTCYEYNGTLFYEVRAGVLLPNGRAFEVCSEMLDAEGTFGFEQVRSFFEGMEIKESK